jgi:hypothetical protein
MQTNDTSGKVPIRHFDKIVNGPCASAASNRVLREE